MQSIPAQTPTRTWQRWAWALGLGIILGLLQALIGWVSLGQISRSSILPDILWVGVFLYIFIPALGGFLATRQSGKVSSGVGAGLRVGLVGWLSISLAIIIGVVLTTPSCDPHTTSITGDCGNNIYSDTGRFAEVFTIIVVLLEGLGAFFGSLLGGGLGGYLAQQLAVPPAQNSSTDADNTL